MNSFNLLVFENGTFTPTQGLLVLPFNFGSLLDERLDESYVTTQRDPREHYENNTLVRIDLYQDGILSASKYGVVANDNGYENPIGSGKYTHKLYIIEATKRLEAVVCQSLTFTNSRGKEYEFAGAQGEYGEKPFYGEYKKEGDVSFSTIKKYVLPNTFYNIPSCREIFNAIGLSVPKIIGVVTIYYTLKYIYDPLIGSSYSTNIEFPPGRSWVATAEESLDQSISYLSPEKNTDYSITYNLVVEGKIDTLNPDGSTSRETSNEYYVVTFPITTTINGDFSLVYPTKRLTILDCCNRVLDLAEPLFLGETPRYAIDPAQTAWLDGILAPEFTMTQCTLREQLRIIGGYIHAEPRLVWDAAKNDGTFYIHFDRYGQVTQSAQISEGTPYITKKVSQDINNYCTKIDTTASNLVNTLDFASGVIATPNIRDLTTIRTETMYVRIDESNGIVTTTFPIREIKKVTCAFFDNIEDPEGDTGYGKKIFGEMDITPYIFEKTEYDANLSSFGGGYPTSKSFALYYAIGQKNLGGLFFKPADDSFLGNLTGAQGYFQYYSIVNIISAVSGYAPSFVRDTISSNGGYPMLAFRVEYVPIYNARFSLEKQYFDSSIQNDYAKIYNQGENMIETRYYGENIRGVVARLGNVEQERTYVFKRLSQIPQIGDMVDDYAISAVSTEFSPSYIKCTVALTKDFNRISQFIGVNSTKRVYEVSERETYARNVLLKEFVVVGDEIENKKGLAPDAPPIFHDSVALESIFSDQLKFNKISAVNACGFSKPSTDFKDSFGMVLLPVISSAFGNAMTFSWNYKDNYSAGGKTVESEQVDGENSKIKGYWQQDVPYGDYYGRSYWYYFRLMNGFPTDGSSMEEALNLPESTLMQPDANSNIGTFDHNEITEGTHKAIPYLCRKDSRETLNFTYMVEFVANQPDLIIGSAMPKLCFLVSGTDNHPTGKPILVLLDRKIGKFERKLEINDYFDLGRYLVMNNDGNLFLSMNVNSEHESWAIITPPQEQNETVVDEDGNTVAQTTQIGGEIILASNNPINSSRNIYLTAMHKIRD